MSPVFRRGKWGSTRVRLTRVLASLAAGLIVCGFAFPRPERKPTPLIVRVTSAEGQPAEGVRVIVARNTEALDALQHARPLPWRTTDASGVCRFEKLPPGAYWVAVTIPGSEALEPQSDRRQGPSYLFWRGGAWLTPNGDPVEAVIRVPGRGAARLWGTVKDPSGAVAAGARVTVLAGPRPDTVLGETWAPYVPPGQPHELPGKARPFGPTVALRITDSEGHFEFASMPEGDYTLLATPGPGEAGSLQTLHLGAGSKIELAINLPAAEQTLEGVYTVGGKAPASVQGLFVACT
ncbi:MAG: carboxypeptidase regulatory-like domain-containing protein, partial [Fimbriimonas ginsengisoli]|nr:carboxypeptidase regulatory-like domain-containing protein [Fimbriimonas ginsengisoli]